MVVIAVRLVQKSVGHSKNMVCSTKHNQLQILRNRSCDCQKYVTASRRCNKYKKRKSSSGGPRPHLSAPVASWGSTQPCGTQLASSLSSTSQVSPNASAARWADGPQPWWAASQHLWTRVTVLVSLGVSTAGCCPVAVRSWECSV